MREEFDSSLDFFAVKAFTYNGRSFGIGDLFQKGLADSRRLRQLYDTRYLRQEIPVEESREERERSQIEIGQSPIRKEERIKEAKKRARAA